MSVVVWPPSPLPPAPVALEFAQILGNSTPNSPCRQRLSLANKIRHRWATPPADEWRVHTLRRNVAPRRGLPPVARGQDDEIERFAFAPAPRTRRAARPRTPDPFEMTPPPSSPPPPVQETPAPEASNKTFLYLPNGDGDDYKLIELSDDLEEQMEQIDAYMRGLAEEEERRKSGMGMEDVGLAGPSEHAGQIPTA
ncbi:hypothetical protein OF83DRAFT_1080412 [Amylostereum chailletii]|nr:hypothetical protein OF83DRAFT_1080412 [Amylostereum chailletii]